MSMAGRPSGRENWRLLKKAGCREAQTQTTKVLPTD